jgi:fumarate reductase subunit D
MDQEQQTQQNQQPPQKSQTNINALISYIGPLCVVPLLTKDQDEFVKFHMKQGLVLFGLEVAASIIFSIIPILWAIGWIFNIAWLVLSIIGIMNVVKNEKKELPLVGKFAEKIKL